MTDTDYVVLRHGLDVPDEYRAPRLEGLWIDVSNLPRHMRHGVGVGDAVADATGRFEVRDDGAVAEVYEIRLTTPNERRDRP